MLLPIIKRRARNCDIYINIRILSWHFHNYHHHRDIESKLIREIRGIDFAPIKFDVADDLFHWSTEIPGKVVAKAEALSGPMTPPNKWLITLNREVGPDAVATWGKAVTDEVNNAMGFKWEWNGRSSKCIHLTGAVLILLMSTSYILCRP